MRIWLVLALVVLAGCSHRQPVRGMVVAKRSTPRDTITCQTGSVNVGNVAVPIYGQCEVPARYYVTLAHDGKRREVSVGYDDWKQMDEGEEWAA